MPEEIFARSVRGPNSLKRRIRGAARSAYLSGRGALRRKAGSRRALHCIMGHYVFDDQREVFASQIAMLRDRGEFVSTENAVAMVTGAVPVDGHYFHLSFDDGLECLLRNAAPILDAAGIPTLVFVNSALAGGATPTERVQWERATNYATSLRVMDWTQLAASGFEVGAHSRTHYRLSDISGSEVLLRSEIAGCKTEIEAALGRTCDYFAWPFGSHRDIDDTAHRAIRSTGYKASFSAVRESIVPGRTDPYSIPRHHFEPQWPLNHLKYFLS